jgi:hypothetical protein
MWLKTYIKHINYYDTLDDFDNLDENNIEEDSKEDSDKNNDVEGDFRRSFLQNPLPMNFDTYSSAMSPTAISYSSPSDIKLPNPSKTIKTIKKDWKNKVKQDPRSVNLKEEENEEKNELIDMSFLLNLLDGVLETPGRIIIMTSNHPETLDQAMIRPGRIDIISKFTVCSHSTIIEMIEFFYNILLTDKQKKQIYMLKCNITPAEMGKLMFENFGEPDVVINKLLAN